MQLIPAIDVLHDRVVRLRQGRADDVTVYDRNPADRIRAWQSEGADLVHVVDISGALEGIWNPRLWRGLGTTGVAFQAGGGIRSPATATGTVRAGAERVVLGSTAVWNPNLMRSIVGQLGPDRVVAAVDVRDGRAVGAGWTDDGKPLDEVLVQLTEAGVTRALVTGIAGDGMLTGPALDLLAYCAEKAPGLRIIASGGVGSLDHLRQLRALPLDGVIVGRALYEGAFTLAEGLEVLQGSTP